MSAHSFSLGITYWPRRRRLAEQVLCTWGEADRGALRDELAHIAELDFDTVCLELRWAEVQPGTRVDTAALHGLERALTLAHDRGLRVVVAVLGGSSGGALHLPAWAVGYRLPGDARRARRFGPPVLVVPAHQPAILAGDRYLAEPVRDLYGEPEILEAQRLLLHEVVGNLGAHPAIWAWQLGADLERTRRPPTAQVAADWWAGLAGRARDHGARAVMGTVSPVSLGRRDTLRPAAIVGAGGSVVVSAAPLPPLPPMEAVSPEAVRFLHALVAGLVRAETGQSAPVIVTDVGLPTVAAGAEGLVAGELFGRSAMLLLGDEGRQAALLEEALPMLHQDGAGGVWLARYGDLDAEQWGVAPADRSWWARTAGLVAPDGREKRAAAALRAFATRLRTGTLPTPVGPPALPLDPERHWFAPGVSFKALWEDWQR